MARNDNMALDPRIDCAYPLTEDEAVAVVAMLRDDPEWCYFAKYAALAVVGVDHKPLMKMVDEYRLKRDG